MLLSWHANIPLFTPTQRPAFAYFMADCGDSPCILCSFYITFKRTVFQGIFPPRGNCAHSVTGATCHGGRRKWTTQLKRYISRKEKQLVIKRQRRNHIHRRCLFSFCCERVKSNYFFTACAVFLTVCSVWRLLWLFAHLLFVKFVATAIGSCTADKC